MNIPLKKTILFVATLLTVCGCQFDYLMPGTDFISHPVVNCILTADEQIVLTLHMSKHMQDPTPYKVVKDAVVKIYENERLVVDRRYGGEPLQCGYVAKSGAVYKLEVTIPEFETVWAQTRVPYPAVAQAVYKECKYGSFGHTYCHCEIKNISSKDADVKAVWLGAVTFHMVPDSKEIIEDMSKEFFATNSFFDQINSCNSYDQVDIKGSATLFEKFIRVYCKDMPFAFPAALSFTTQTVYDNNTPGDLFPDRKEILPYQLDLKFIAASAEYDKFYKSYYKQYLKSYDVDIPLFHENVYVESNIHNGLGIFAGRAVTTVSLQVTQ